MNAQSKIDETTTTRKFRKCHKYNKWAGMCGVCVGVRECVWDEFSEYLLSGL